MTEQENQDLLENSSVSVRYKKRPGCLIKMDVLVAQEATQATYQKAIKEVRKETSVPGFRKGKVPEDLLKKHFSDAIESQFRSLVTEIAFKEGISLIKRPPFAKTSIRKVEIVSLDKEKGAEVYFEYEASPEVPPVNPDLLEIQAIPVVSPTEEDVNTQLLRVRLLHAERKPAEEGRSCAMGDFVKLRILSPETEESLLDTKELYLHPKFCDDWLLPSVLGMQKGERKEIEIPEPHTKGILVVEEIDTCLLPEDDDSFAQKAHAANREDLLSKVRSRLTFEAQFKAFEEIRHEVRNELIRLWAFDLPQSLIEGETEARFSSYWNTLTKQTSQSPALDKEKIKKEFLDEVKRYFTLLFLLKPIAQHSLKIGTIQQSEVLEELTHQMMHAPFETRYIYPGLPEQEAHHRLLMALMMRKCEDWCIEKKLGLTMPERS